ncbi:MAG: hypothetical protein IIB45_12045 [Candidatus Marinimicrobia bacterium]|nr:hypothetical protein [Candidatus Neomarinimicrobiota bacterium]
MIKDKLLLSKTIEFMFSSAFVSILVSMCLLVNLFAPGLSTVTKGKSIALQFESHACECSIKPHSINSCCCAEEVNTSEKECLLKDDTGSLFTAFIQSLACAGIPDQFTPISYNISLPGDGISFPDIYRFYYIERLQTVFPTSIKMSPPYKPPRII